MESRACKRKLVDNVSDSKIDEDHEDHKDENSIIMEAALPCTYGYTPSQELQDKDLVDRMHDFPQPQLLMGEENKSALSLCSSNPEEGQQKIQIFTGYGINMNEDEDLNISESEESPEAVRQTTFPSNGGEFVNPNRL